MRVSKSDRRGDVCLTLPDIDLTYPYTFAPVRRSKLTNYSAKKLSSSDWVGFDLIWKKRLGNIALKDALHNHMKFEEVHTLDNVENPNSGDKAG